ncbi:MAG: transglycosylase SLT domain-containing protein [Rikenellaceae bacterium]
MFNKTLIILAFFNLFSLTTNTALSTSRTTEDGKFLHNKWETTVQISPYDHLFRSLSEQHGNDWRLLCAMAYHESRFQPDVTSRCGARGILQVMPNVAKQFDISVEQLYNVEDNIYVANKVLTLIDDMLKLPEATPSNDRLKLTLAAYNCGIGRVADARRLARSFGESTTSWDVVAKYLSMMNSPEYYQLDAVKYGRFTGAGQTLAYVKNVVNHYESYCTLAMR